MDAGWNDYGRMRGGVWQSRVVLICTVGRVRVHEHIYIKSVDLSAF